jgi:phosphoheptose isomerase
MHSGHEGNKMSTNKTTNNVKSIFDNSIKTKQEAKEQLSTPITTAIETIATALKKGNKILSCGNGGSAADAQHFAAELVCRFEKERPALAAIALTVDSSALTAISNDYHFDEIFARQIEALAKPDDILLAISTSGFSPNVVRAIEQAHEKKMTVVALTGRDGGKVAKTLTTNDIEIRVLSESTARIQEIHLLTIHCLCDQIDEILFPEES